MLAGRGSSRVKERWLTKTKGRSGERGVGPAVGGLGDQVPEEKLALVLG
jgi:hypothetical protein